MTNELDPREVGSNAGLGLDPERAAFELWLAATHVPALRKMDSSGAHAAGYAAGAAAERERSETMLAMALDEIARLRTGLRFYARGEHFNVDRAEEFDTVSGEPQNWLFSGVDGSTTMIEDGEIARRYLMDIAINWIDGDDDETPQPIDGEVSCVDEPPND